MPRSKHILTRSDFYRSWRERIRLNVFRMQNWTSFAYAWTRDFRNTYAHACPTFFDRFTWLGLYCMYPLGNLKARPFIGNERTLAIMITTDKLKIWFVMVRKYSEYAVFIQQPWNIIATASTLRLFQGQSLSCKIRAKVRLPIVWLSFQLLRYFLRAFLHWNLPSKSAVYEP